MVRTRPQSAWSILSMLLLMVLMIGCATARMTCNGGQPDILIEVESPPGSGNFVPLDFSIVPTTTTLVRITLDRDLRRMLEDVTVSLAHTDTTVATEDITDLFREDLRASGTATAPVPVLIDNNAITVTVTAGGQTTAAAASMLNFSDAIIVVGANVSFPLDSTLVEVEDSLAFLSFEGNVIMLSFDMKAPYEGASSMSRDAINGLLRAEKLRPLDFSDAINLLRAEITTGENPYDLAQRLAAAGLPFLQAAIPNLVVEDFDVAGETLPARLNASYRAAGNMSCERNGGDLKGCFDIGGDDSANELRIFRYHFLMDTFAGHRLVDRIVGASPAQQAGLAIIDQGLGSYGRDPCGRPGFNTVSDVPCSALFNISNGRRGTLRFDTLGRQINARGAVLALNLKNIKDDSRSHGTRVTAAAAGRGAGRRNAGRGQGRGVLGTGKHVRIRPIRRNNDLNRSIYAVVAAIQDSEVVVFNTSWGLKKPGQQNRFTAAQLANGMPNVMTLARQQGKIWVTAGNNSGSNTNGRDFPADFAPPRNNNQTRSQNTNLVMRVCATGTAGTVRLSGSSNSRKIRGAEELSAFSSFGNRQSVTAPGDEVVLPSRAGVLSTTTQSASGGRRRGCSFSAPAVAGLAAEMIYLDRNIRADTARMTPLQIVELIEATAEDLGSNAATGRRRPRPNDNPGNGWDPFFGHGRISVWKALLAVTNGGVAVESHRPGTPSDSTLFPSLRTRIIGEANTPWYGFRIITSVLGATVWIDGQQLQDAGATMPNGPAITAYKGVRSDQVIRLGIPNEDPTSGIVPLGNGGGEYVMTFSIQRSDLLNGANPRTLSLRRPGQGINDAPFYTLKLDLQRMRNGQVSGVVFDDFVFEVTPTDFGDATERVAEGGARGYPTTLAANGARHLNTNLEWFGRPDSANVAAISPEQNAEDNPAGRIPDPDGLNNVRLTPLAADRDRFDDGLRFFPLTYKPAQQGKVEFTVCVADPDGGRYANDPDRLLYVNGWIDWNTNGAWDENNREHIVNGVRLDPNNWRQRGGMPRVTRKRGQRANNCATFTAMITVGQLIGTGELWARFRVDYGENVRGNVAGFPPAPTLSNTSTDTLTTGAVRFGEVEDYLLGSDFGDAPDPPDAKKEPKYPTRKESRGARHLDMNREWLGKPSFEASVTRETDACDTTPAEEDRVPNLGKDPCIRANQDKKDDGVSLDSLVAPNQEITVEIDVSAKIDAFGFTNRGPGGEDSKGVMTLKKNCMLGPIPDMPDTPEFHRDRGRYAAWDSTRRLYLNVWADWNADSVWVDAEKVISGPLDPEDWGKDGAYTLGEPFADADSNRVRTPGEAPTDTGGVTTRHLSCTVTVPDTVNMERPYYWRFRLDYGENVITDATVVHHATEDNRALDQTFGGALWGEVEDYKQKAGEVDEMPKTESRVTLHGPFGAWRVVLTGPTTIFVHIGNVADTDGDGREQVVAEMILMELTGSTPLGPLTLRLRDPSKHPNKRSLGEIEEHANNTPGVLDVPPFTATGSATSFFDVYFEAQVGDRLLHTHEPKRMRSVITFKAPRERYRNHDLLELFDEEEYATGIFMGSAFLIPFPDEEEPDFEALIEDLGSPDVFVRMEVATDLGRFGPRAVVAVAALAGALADEEAGMRERAARALGALGPVAAEAIPVLQEALQDPDENVRRAAAEALALITRDRR